MDAIAFALLAVAALLTMAFKSLVSPTLLALAMTHLLQLSGSMQVRRLYPTCVMHRHHCKRPRLLGLEGTCSRRVCTIILRASCRSS